MGFSSHPLLARATKAGLDITRPRRRRHGSRTANVLTRSHDVANGRVWRQLLFPVVLPQEDMLPECEVADAAIGHADEFVRPARDALLDRALLVSVV